MAEAKYWSSPVGALDDFNNKIGYVIYDARTKRGPWALMSGASFDMYGTGRVGPGFGQKYEKQPDGRWLKTAG